MLQKHKNKQIYLAPIRGITDSIYRNTFFKFFKGFDLAICPFITTVKGDKIKPSHLKDVMPENNFGMPLIPQILSKNSDLFVNMAIRLFDMGYENINWNLGCPYPMVAKKKRGSGLLPFPDSIKSFLDDSLKKIPNKLSIKCRLGRHSPGEILKIIPVFNEYPINEIIIHPRTGIQMYNGSCDLDSFEKCCALSKTSVVYNGDIIDALSFNMLTDRFPDINKWMIGRGALSNPFLPGLIKKQKVKLHESNIIIKAFHDELFIKYSEILFGQSHILGKMKGIWFYLSNFFENHPKLLKKIQRVKTLKSYKQIIAKVFDEPIL